MPNNDEFDKIMEEFNSKKDAGPEKGKAPEPAEQPGSSPASEQDGDKPSPRFELNIQDDEFEALDRFDESQAGGEHRAEATTIKPKKKRKKGVRLAISLAVTVLILAVCVYLAYFVIDSANDLFGLNQADKEVEVNIPEGASTSQIVSILKENEVISQPLAYRLYSKLKKADGKYQAGTYKLNANMSYDSVIYNLTTSSQRVDVVDVTFIEGMSLNEIAALLEENGVCEAEAFKEVLQTEDFGYEFEELLPEDENIFYRMEGYVFPDTYTFYIGEHPKSVAKKFLDNFNNKMTADLWQQMEEMGLSLNETITLASIIQKEAGGSPEMYNVSSVFHNRLNSPEVFPLLQSDVTVFYVEDDIKPYIAEKNQVMYDAYNTYVCEGIPVGPICNPGLEAIKAALYPNETDYYFFVTDKNGKFYYAVTYNEQLANEQEAETVGNGVEHGTNVN